MWKKRNYVGRRENKKSAGLSSTVLTDNRSTFYFEVGLRPRLLLTLAPWFGHVCLNRLYFWISVFHILSEKFIGRVRDMWKKYEIKILIVTRGISLYLSREVNGAKFFIKLPYQLETMPQTHRLGRHPLYFLNNYFSNGRRPQTTQQQQQLLHVRQGESIDWIQYF